jgi:glycosyltransferase involved in cell wall biosynthesis
MKICTWGDVASALEGKTSGGGELQIALLTKVLAKLGHEVVIVDLMAKESFVTKDGIKVIPIEGYHDTLRIFRLITHLIPKLYQSLKAQDADFYYCQIRDFKHMLAFRAARKTNGIFMIQLASDLDSMNFKMRVKHDYLTHFEGLYWFLKVVFTELIFPKLVRNANAVLVQHVGQKDTLAKKGIKSVIFNNLIELHEIPQVSDPVREDFCYVGALDKRKGFAEFFQLVEKAPFATFKVIGQPRDRTGYKYYEKLKSYSNVKLFGNLSHSDTLTHIMNSKALISTSPMEGFPNIFVEAWACGIPVLSLSFDPGGVMKKEKLGEVADGNLDKLVGYMKSVQNTEEFAKRAKEYVDKNHVVNEEKIKEIDNLFNQLYKDRKLK